MKQLPEQNTSFVTQHEPADLDYMDPRPNSPLAASTFGSPSLHIAMLSRSSIISEYNSPLITVNLATEVSSLIQFRPQRLHQTRHIFPDDAYPGLEQDLDVQKTELLITRRHSAEQIAGKQKYGSCTSQNRDQAIVLASDIPISCLPGSVFSRLLGLPHRYTNGACDIQPPCRPVWRR